MFIVLFMLPDNKSDVADQVVDKIAHSDFINKCDGLIPLHWVGQKCQEEEQGRYCHAHRVYDHSVTLAPVL